MSMLHGYLGKGARIFYRRSAAKEMRSKAPKQKREALIVKPLCVPTNVLPRYLDVRMWRKDLLSELYSSTYHKTKLDQGIQCLISVTTENKNDREPICGKWSPTALSTCLLNDQSACLPAKYFRLDEQHSREAFSLVFSSENYHLRGGFALFCRVFLLIFCSCYITISENRYERIVPIKDLLIIMEQNFLSLIIESARNKYNGNSTDRMI